MQSVVVKKKYKYDILYAYVWGGKCTGQTIWTGCMNGGAGLNRAYSPDFCTKRLS